MAIGEVVGLISELWRFPVKSRGGERLSEVDVTERGSHGDRAYALIDMETGRVVSLYKNSNHLTVAARVGI